QEIVGGHRPPLQCDSKLILQAELNDSRISSGHDSAELVAFNVAVGVQEVRVVQDVACLHSELHGLSFADVKRSRQPEIDSPGAWTQEDRLSRRAQLSQGRYCKRAPVEPPARGIRRAQVGPALI